jgi:hypothetical protein
LSLPRCPAAFAEPSSPPAAGDDAAAAHGGVPSRENPRRAQCILAPADPYERSAPLTVLHRRRGDEEGEGSKKNAADDEAMAPDMVHDARRQN